MTVFPQMMMPGGVAGELPPMELIVGANGTRVTNNNTWNFGSLALNDTAVAGDLIVVCVTAEDNDLEDPVVGLTLAGWDGSIEDTASNPAGGRNDTLQTAIAWKTAAGGETTVAVSGSWSGFSGTFDATDCKVFLIRGLSSNTPLATSTSSSINTAGARIVFGATGNMAVSGGGNTVTQDFSSDLSNYVFWDDSPLGGASDSYGTGTSFTAQTIAAWK